MLPNTMNATIVIARNPAVPPDVSAMTETSHCEKPDCVNAQAIAVAVPMISITAPVSNAVSMSIG